MVSWKGQCLPHGRQTQVWANLQRAKTQIRDSVAAVVVVVVVVVAVVVAIVVVAIVVAQEKRERERDDLKLFLNSCLEREKSNGIF